MLLRVSDIPLSTGPCTEARTDLEERLPFVAVHCGWGGVSNEHRVFRSATVDARVLRAASAAPWRRRRTAGQEQPAHEAVAVDAIGDEEDEVTSGDSW